MKLLRRKPDHQAGAPSPWFACDLFSEVKRTPDLPYGPCPCAGMRYVPSCRRISGQKGDGIEGRFRSSHIWT